MTDQLRALRNEVIVIEAEYSDISRQPQTQARLARLSQLCDRKQELTRQLIDLETRIFPASHSSA